MKTVILSLLFVSASAFATTQPEAISLICDGYQAATGGPKTGQFVLKASTQGVYVNPTWTFDAGWAGEGALVGSGISCGANLPAAKRCFEHRTGADIFVLTQDCGGWVYNGGVPHSEYTSSAVLDGDHGFFNCRGADYISQHIQLSNCH